MKKLPVEIVFNPKWWHENAGINFDENFFFDAERRVDDEMKMRNYLYERFHIEGLGEKERIKKPVIGPVHLAAGYIIPQLFGCKIVYHIDGPPDVIPLNLSDDEIMHLIVPDLKNASPVNRLITMMDTLEKEYGYLEGDIDWSGVLNHALDIRGHQIFMDMYDDSKIAGHLFDILYETVLEFTEYMLSRTGSTSISVNPQTRNFRKKINLHSNCSVAMISNDMYEKNLLKYDILLSEHLQPYGIHHCGDNMEKVAKGYAKIPDVSFFDVGYGSDVKECRKYLPDAFFNLRLSPVKMLHCSSEQVRDDIIYLLEQNGGVKNAGLCCINMDFNTPDENIRMIYETADNLR
ncbi:MAG: hypothetical protein JXQ23_08005 [Clostridia bacterium]|nr:hypothetical protein [Clostridia bacterium]